MTNEQLKQRTKSFAIAILDYADSLPKNDKGRVVSRQLIRSATSTAANYRAACRARSDREFISKLNIVLEEADESMFWLELIDESKLIKSAKTEKLKQESNELVAIFVSTLRTIKKRMK